MIKKWLGLRTEFLQKY